MIDAKRGSISAGVVADPDHREVYTLDATGNWSRYFVEDDGATTWKQRRDFNVSNEITDLTNWVVPEYDLAGNMTTIPQPADPTSGYSLVWDGWNRLVKVMDGTTTVEEYAYDGLMRRVTVDDQTDVRHFYYSLQWQVLEERLNALTTADKQYIWGIRYIDDLVMRETASGETTDIYVTKDRMWSIRTLIGEGEETVLQRFIYNPYGEAIVLDDSFGPTNDGHQWEFRFQGRRQDQGLEILHFRVRQQLYQLGVFASRDRIHRGNMYEFVQSQPNSLVDPLGLQGLSADDIRRRDYFRRIFSPLPDCPCHEDEIDVNVFTLSNDFIEEYHPGASNCYRTISATRSLVATYVEQFDLVPYGMKYTISAAGWVLGGLQDLAEELTGLPAHAPATFLFYPGQQCCFDAERKLINRGIGAGTPDLYSPTGILPGNRLAMTGMHYLVDVLPLDFESYTPEEYILIWEPNIGKDNEGDPCPENPKQ